MTEKKDNIININNIDYKIDIYNDILFIQNMTNGENIYIKKLLNDNILINNKITITILKGSYRNMYYYEYIKELNVTVQINIDTYKDDNNIADDLDNNDIMLQFEYDLILTELCDETKSNQMEQYGYLVRNNVPNIILDSNGSCLIRKSKDIVADLITKLDYESNQFGDTADAQLDDLKLLNYIATLASIYMESNDCNLEYLIDGVTDIIETKGSYSDNIILEEYRRD